MLYKRIITLVVMVFVLGQFQKAAAQDKERWHGYEVLDSSLNGRSYKLVFPEEPNEKRDWIWRARFWGHEPQTDRALLERGFHIAYCDVSNCPVLNDLHPGKNKFYPTFNLFSLDI